MTNEIEMEEENAIYFQPSPMGLATGEDGSVYIRVSDFMDNLLSLRSEIMKKEEVPDLSIASKLSINALDAVLAMLNDAPKENEPI